MAEETIKIQFNERQRIALSIFLLVMAITGWYMLEDHIKRQKIEKCLNITGAEKALITEANECCYMTYDNVTCEHMDDLGKEKGLWVWPNATSFK